MHFDYAWLDTFLAVAEAGGFSQAARRLHLSQPAVHTQVKKLGQALAVPLYVRRGRNIELTRQGHRVLAFARESRSEQQRFVAELRGEVAPSRAVLCAGEGLHLYALGAAVRRVVERGHAIGLLVRDGVGTRDAVAHGEADVGVLPLELAHESGLEVRVAFEARARLVVPEAHPLAGKVRVKIAELEGESLIAPPRGRPQRTAIEAAFAIHGLAPRVVVEATGWPLVLHFVALGAGVAFVNDYCALPRGTTSLAVPELAAVRYAAVRRASGGRSAVHVALFDALSGQAALRPSPTTKIS